MYPTWALNRVKMRNQTAPKKKNNNNRNFNPNNSMGPKPHIRVPYHQGLSESTRGLAKNMA